MFIVLLWCYLQKEKRTHRILWNYYSCDVRIILKQWPLSSYSDTKFYNTSCVKFKWPITKIVAYLAISALLLASSAIWLSSVKCVRSVNIFVSGGCNPCNVLCACAHWSSRCSFPKSFCLVKAICITKKSINKNS